jgi:SPP1 family predicted phage head-tail adaptor
MTKYVINPGKYRHVVTIQKQLETDNPYGERPRNDDANWENVLTTRAAIFPISGRDIFEAMRTESEMTHRIFVRFNPTLKINSSMRILFGDRIFDIISPPINFQEKNIELSILCKERG